MDVTHLVGVHEAGIAHHVAAVRQVDGQNGAAAMLNRAAAVIVKLLVVVRRDVAPGEVLLDPLEKLHVDSHEVFSLAVLRAFLHHPDLTVALDDLGFDLADLLMEQTGYIPSCR